MKTFRADSSWRYQIDEHDLIKEKAHFIFVSLQDGTEFKEKKESSSHKYFSNYKDAKQWLMDQLDMQIKNVQSQVDRLKSQKQKVNNL